ncbi:MAG TPA: hypothetical protein VK629_05250, partial [Steroidobacteraceae bacterium]|nr:hypothetical protein [Steroidobacteraceae bacterium]
MSSRHAAWGVSLVLFAGSVQAADQCRIGETIQQCWEHYLPSTPAKTMSTGTHAKAAGAAADATKDKLERFETGLGGGAPELGTTTRNFLPLLAFSGLLSDADGNNSDSLYAIDLNFLIPGLANDNNAQLKAILNTDPRLFGPTKEALDIATGDAVRSDALQGRLSASDDYTIAFTYSLINDKFGRSFEQYRYRFSNLFEAAITSVQSPTDPETALLKMGPLLQEL